MTLRPLGKNQSRIISRMRDENLVIRVVRIFNEKHDQISLQDEEGANEYESISGKFLESLWKRKILSSTSWMPALYIEVITFRLK